MNPPFGAPNPTKQGWKPWSFYGEQCTAMTTILLATEFQDFLKSLNTQHAEYLLIGGYAVGYHGYPRTTGDLDIWFAQTPANAQKISRALQTFGFHADHVPAAMFLEPDCMFRMGNPPLRIELLTAISGIHFADCWPHRQTAIIENIPIPIIDLDSLKANKRASARYKDLNDLENLP